MTDDPHRRTGGYLLVMGVYGGVVGSLTALARLLGRRPPERISPGDVVLLSVATHKLSRLLAKDAVTTPLRAPFTRFEVPRARPRSTRARGPTARSATPSASWSPAHSAW